MKPGDLVRLYGSAHHAWADVKPATNVGSAAYNITWITPTRVKSRLGIMLGKHHTVSEVCLVLFHSGEIGWVSKDSLDSLDNIDWFC